MLAVLAFAVIVWMTEALDYAVSAVVIAALMAFLSDSPDPANPKALMGTSAGLGPGLQRLCQHRLGVGRRGAVSRRGHDRDRARPADRAGHSLESRHRTRHIVIGAMLVGFVLSFLVPSTTARVACLVPIMLGIIARVRRSKKSRFAGMLIITTAQTASIWNVGIKTAAAQNMVAIGFIEKMFQTSITWLEWFIAGAPFGRAHVDRALLRR